MDNINVKISGHEVYKAIQNFLVNEQKITKQYIEQEVEKRIDRIIGQHIEKQFQANNIINIIKNSIANYFKAGVPPTNGSLWQSNAVFDTWLQGQIREVIREEILGQYSIVLNTNKAFEVEKKNG